MRAVVWFWLRAELYTQNKNLDFSLFYNHVNKLFLTYRLCFPILCGGAGWGVETGSHYVALTVPGPGWPQTQEFC